MIGFVSSCASSIASIATTTATYLFHLHHFNPSFIEVRVDQATNMTTRLLNPYFVCSAICCSRAQCKTNITVSSFQTLGPCRLERGFRGSFVAVSPLFTLFFSVCVFVIFFAIFLLEATGLLSRYLACRCSSYALMRSVAKQCVRGKG